MVKAQNLIRLLEKSGWQYLQDAARVNHNVPKRAGIYCFVSYNTTEDVSQVIYVGKSVDLSVRLKPWHRIENKFDKSLGSLYCYVLYTDNQDKEEIEYIKKFMPIYNVQHNPKIRRSIIYLNGNTVWR